MTRSALTPDEALQALPDILERLTRIEDLLLKQAAAQPRQKVLFDWHDLKAQGIGEREAYAILRRYAGTKVKGRRQRITYDQLMDYYKREDDR